MQHLGDLDIELVGSEKNDMRSSMNNVHFTMKNYAHFNIHTLKMNMVIKFKAFYRLFIKPTQTAHRFF